VVTGAENESRRVHEFHISKESPDHFAAGRQAPRFGPAAYPIPTRRPNISSVVLAEASVGAAPHEHFVILSENLKGDSQSIFMGRRSWDGSIVSSIMARAGVCGSSGSASAGPG